MIVCDGLTRFDDDGADDDAAGFAYERASSISAAVPEALSTAPGLSPVLSRWAMTTIADCERPGATAMRFTNRNRPRPATVASNGSTCVVNPYGCSSSTNHAAALAAPVVSGARSG